MNELQVHQCLVSFGNLPMLIVLKELEDNEEYEKCAIIKNGIDSYSEKYCTLLIMHTIYSKDFEERYYNQFKNFTNTECEIAKSNMKYYVSEVKQKLEI